jgi:hypothetical protein
MIFKMKKLLFCCLLFSSCIIQVDVQPEKKEKLKPDNCYKGRLSLKGICNNYVIELIDGAIDTSKVAVHWTNPETGKIYNNAFALSNRCALPVSLKEGDEFLFKLDSSHLNAECNTCAAYSPTPKKTLSISICP